MRCAIIVLAAIWQSPQSRVSEGGFPLHEFQVVTTLRLGLAIEEIVEKHPALDPKEIHAALAYFHLHRAEIERYLAEDREVLASASGQTAGVLATFTSTWTRLFLALFASCCVEPAFKPKLASRGARRHIRAMAATAENLQRLTNSHEGIEDWVRRHTRQWCEMCDEFKEATRQTMLVRQPSESELEQHRKGMKMFLRVTRLLHAEVADPDFPDRSLAAELAMRLRQMEDLWEMIHNPMPDDEADKLLRAAFPK